MKWIDKIKKIESKLDIKTWGNGYKINKIIFNLVIFIMLILFLILWSNSGFQNIKTPNYYFECDNIICINEFYEYCNPLGTFYYQQNRICNNIPEYYYTSKVLKQGESIGEKPSIIFTGFKFIFFSLLLLAIIINHLLYNKGWRKQNGKSKI